MNVSGGSRTSNTAVCLVPRTSADGSDAGGGEFAVDHSEVHARPNLRARASELLTCDGTAGGSARNY